MEMVLLTTAQLAQAAGNRADHAANLAQPGGWHTVCQAKDAGVLPVVGCAGLRAAQR